MQDSKCANDGLHILTGIDVPDIEEKWLPPLRGCPYEKRWPGCEVSYRYCFRRKTVKLDEIPLRCLRNGNDGPRSSYRKRDQSIEHLHDTPGEPLRVKRVRDIVNSNNSGARKPGWEDIGSVVEVEMISDCTERCSNWNPDDRLGRPDPMNAVDGLRQRPERICVYWKPDTIKSIQKAKSVRFVSGFSGTHHMGVKAYPHDVRQLKRAADTPSAATIQGYANQNPVVVWKASRRPVNEAIAPIAMKDRDVLPRMPRKVAR